jgi:hypothetical protein
MKIHTVLGCIEKFWVYASDEEGVSKRVGASWIFSPRWALWLPEASVSRQLCVSSSWVYELDSDAQGFCRMTIPEAKMERGID